MASSKPLCKKDSVYVWVCTDKLLVFVSSCPRHESTGYCKKLAHMHEARALHTFAIIYTPENFHDTEKTKHLKIYLLLKMVMSHCHASFWGCTIFGFWYFWVRTEVQFPKTIPVFYTKVPHEALGFDHFACALVKLDSEEKIVIKRVYRGFSPKDCKYEDILFLAGLQKEYCIFLL